MADVLVMNQNNGADPFHWKKGMVVDVLPDGQLGPGLQQHPRFWIIRLPNCTVGELQFLLEPQFGPQEVVGPQADQVRFPKGKRKDGFDDLKIPQAVLNALAADREFTSAGDITDVMNWITRLWPDDA